MGKQAKSQALADELIGRSTEPAFKSLFPNKMDLVLGLNYYARTAKHDDLKKYSLDWAAENAPELVERMEKATATDFMSYGALARLHTRGMPLEDQHFDRLIEYFSSLKPKNASQLDDDGNPIEKKQKAKKAPVEKINNTYGFAEEYLDAALSGESYTFNVDMDDNLKEVGDMAKEVLGDVLEYPDDYAPSTLKTLKAACRDIIEKCTKVAAVKKARKTTVRKARNVSPSKIVEKVKYQKEDVGTKQKSLSPIDLLGKKKVYILDTKYKRVIVFSGTEQGFTFKGTTLLNTDLSKSFSKRLKSPESLFKPFNGKPGISELNKMFKDIRNKESPMTTGRFSDSFVILNAS